MQNLRLVVPLGSVDASGPDVRAVFCPSTRCAIKKVMLIDSTAKSGHAANYGTYSLINKGTAAAGTTVIASRATDTPTTDDIAAWVRWNVTMNTDMNAWEVQPNEVVVFQAAETGTADSGDLVEALLVIEYDTDHGGGL